MSKSLLAIYLVTSLVDVSLGLQVQQQTDLVYLRDFQGRTTELEWVWSEEKQSCNDACTNSCPGSECDELARAEIDNENKMRDQEAFMSSHECKAYRSDSSSYGPMVSDDGNCTPGMQGYGHLGCTDMIVGVRFLCACEVVLGTCTVAEDPHINVFDEEQISLLGASDAQADSETLGVKWLVKSARVKIQARFAAKSEAPDTNVFTRAIALSGEILKDNVLIVGSLEDPSTWNGHRILTDQESSFYMKEGSFFVNVTRGASSLVQDPSQDNFGVNIRLPSGVSMVVNRQHHYVNVAIRMPKQASGQEGLCGNFNGLGADDALEMIKSRFSPMVTSEESLFAGLSYD